MLCYIRVSYELKMSKNTKFSSSSSFYVHKNSEAWAFKETNLSWKKIVFYFFGRRFSRAQKRSPTWKLACIRAGCYTLQDIQIFDRTSQSTKQLIIDSYSLTIKKKSYFTEQLPVAAFSGSQRPEGCNVFKKETLKQVFSCEFCEISKNTFFA